MKKLDRHDLANGVLWPKLKVKIFLGTKFMKRLSSK